MPGLMRLNFLSVAEQWKVTREEQDPLSPLNRIAAPSLLNKLASSTLKPRHRNRVHAQPGNRRSDDHQETISRDEGARLTLLPWKVWPSCVPCSLPRGSVTAGNSSWV